MLDATIAVVGGLAVSALSCGWRIVVKMRFSWVVICVACVLVGTACSSSPPTKPIAATQERSEAYRYDWIIIYRQLTNLDAKDGAAMTHDMLGVVTTFDKRTNTVVLKGEPDLVDMALKMLDKLDNVGLCEPSDGTFIKHLKQADAVQLAATFDAMVSAGFFGSDDRTPLPAFVADARTNSLIVYSDSSSGERIRAIIDELDIPVEKK